MRFVEVALLVNEFEIVAEVIVATDMVALAILPIEPELSMAHSKFLVVEL